MARDALRADEAAEAQWKVLIYGWGTPLERQVQQAFELFGFSVEDTEAGRSDLRATRDGQFVVLEVKGLAKSAAEKHAAQLEWVANELAEERTPKGILVVNGWRDLPLSERQEATFPHQMLTYAEQRGHCLVTGLQLLSMVRAVLADLSRNDEVVQLLLETVGPVEGWDDLSATFIGETAEATSVKVAETTGEPQAAIVVDPSPEAQPDDQPTA